LREIFVGLDFGATTTDLVLVKGKRLVGNTFWCNEEKTTVAMKKVKAFLERQQKEICCAGLTGKNQVIKLKEMFSFPVKYFNEIHAIGLGGASACGLRKAVVVSAGTGTCVVFFDGKTSLHLGGTGIGGGTALGLSNLLVNETNLFKLQRLARKGSIENVNLSVFEAIGTRIGLCPREATASNFGKLVNPRKADLIAGVFRMVGETIGVVASLAAKTVNSKNLVFVGRAMELSEIKKTVQETVKMFGLRFFCPKNPGTRTAFGAALLAQKTKNQ
jgi:type II pantothenate kinase